MADTDYKGSPKTPQKESQEALEKQVAQMRREIGKINKVLAERAEDEVAGWYSGASDRAANATQALRSQAQSVSETVKENPGTISTAMLVGGLIGFVLGFAIGQASGEKQRSWY